MKVLVETAQERQETIPAFLYNSSVSMMAFDDDDDPLLSKNNDQSTTSSSSITSSLSSPTSPPTTSFASSGIPLPRQRNANTSSVEDDNLSSQSLDDSDDQQPLVSRTNQTSTASPTLTSPSTSPPSNLPLEEPEQKSIFFFPWDVDSLLRVMMMTIQNCNMNI